MKRSRIARRWSCAWHAPRKLIRIRCAVTLVRRVGQRFPDRSAHRGESNSQVLLKLFAKPILWPNLVVYIFVKLAARYAAKRRLAVGNLSWDRDDSSRSCDEVGCIPSTKKMEAEGAPSRRSDSGGGGRNLSAADGVASHDILQRKIPDQNHTFMRKFWIPWEHLVA